MERFARTRLDWSLDAVMREDQSRVRSGHDAQNLA